MTNNSDQQNQLNSMMEDLRSSYLQDLPDSVENLEQLVLELEQSDDFSRLYEQLFRTVHSLKGSGGTYGYPVISTICHQMEDLLNAAGGTPISLSKQVIDRLLQYIDLLRTVRECHISGDTKLHRVETELYALQQKVLKGRFRCLIVESSTTTRELYKVVLGEENIDITFADSGLEALERLLREKFDLLITGMTIGQLNGRALIAAIKLSDGMNANIPMILLTTPDDDKLALACEPDHVITKDSEMLVTLCAVLQEQLSHNSCR